MLSHRDPCKDAFLQASFAGDFLPSLLSSNSLYILKTAQAMVGESQDTL